MKSTTILSAMTGLLLTVASANAFALCTPDAVAYQNDNGGQVQFRCAENTNVWYLGAVNFYPSTCGARTVDTVKSWLSIVEAAVLSGKSVTVTSASCNGQNIIGNIVLNK